MAKRRFSALEALDFIFNLTEEERDEEEPSEEEKVSEEENITENDDNFIPTDKEDSSKEEEPSESADSVTFKSKDGNVLWSNIPPSDRRPMLSAERERKTQGPTRYAILRADSTKSTFALFMLEEITKIVLERTNKEGHRVYWDNWKKMDKLDLEGYLGLLILAGVMVQTCQPTTLSCCGEKWTQAGIGGRAT